MTTWVWVVDQNYPQGHLVEMTAEQEAAFVAWQQQQAADEAVEQQIEDNEATIRSRLSSVLANLEDAYTNWGTLTAAQKDAALKLDVRVTAGLVRMLLRRLDTAGV